MEHRYSQNHMAHSHNIGIAIGTIVGSCVVTFVIAIIVASSNPKIILHPLSFASDITFKSTQSVNDNELGLAATKSSGYFLTVQPTLGEAAQSVTNSE